MSDGGTDGAALFEAIGLEKRYEDAGRTVEVLSGLDLVVAPRETIAVVGESGVGKSTLLHVLGTLDRPSGGIVRYRGSDLFALSGNRLAEFRNREIGFVFQFHHLLGDLTAEENVMLPARIGGESRERARALAREILARVGLAGRLGHKPGELSGGEQQRVSVARALVRGPRILLADEPTGNLDPATGGEVQELLLELNAERGVALLVATHSRRLADAMGRVLRLASGRLHPA